MVLQLTTTVPIPNYNRNYKNCFKSFSVCKLTTNVSNKNNCFVSRIKRLMENFKYDVLNNFAHILI